MKAAYQAFGVILFFVACIAPFSVRAGEAVSSSRTGLGMSSAEKAYVQENVRLHDEIMEATVLKLQEIRDESRSCADCYAGDSNNTEFLSAERRQAKRACDASWTEFYNTRPRDTNSPSGPKQPLDLRISIGYLDTNVNSVVHDVLVRQTFAKNFTAKCETNLIRACGFKQNQQDGDLFEKEVMGPTGEMQKVALRITSSSYSLLSRKDKDSEADQFFKSKNAEDVYFGGIRDGADYSAYVGHARDSGGPDFAPAVRRKSDGHIDLQKYALEKPGMKRLTKALKDAHGRTPKLMEFLACNTSRWENDVTNLAPNSGLIFSGTDLIALEVSMAKAFTSIDSILWQRCSREFERARNWLKNYRPEDKVKSDTLKQFYRTK